MLREKQLVKIRVPEKPTVPRSRCLSGLCGDDLQHLGVKVCGLQRSQSEGNYAFFAHFMAITIKD